MIGRSLKPGIALLLTICFTSSFLAQPVRDGAVYETDKFVVSPSDDAFLEDLEHRMFLFFWEQSDLKTGLTLDRARTTGEAPLPSDSHYRIASIASTGFALTGYCIAAKRGWVTRREAVERTRNTLDYFANRAFNKNGWFYHWQDQSTGERRWNSEISSIDTALLLGGVLTAQQCFKDDRAIVRNSKKIYDRVDFRWMLNGDPYLLSHGWRPESGFIKNRWSDYSEQMVLTLLGIGSPKHSIPWQAWYAWERGYKSYGRYRYLAAVPPLFIHQYSHAWVDFRRKRERYKDYKTDYFQNSIIATQAQRQFFIDVLSKEFPKYGPNIWGLTASDAIDGYKAWGAPPRDAETDGTVVPYAPAGSLMFTPGISIAALKEMKAKYGDKAYGRY
ncbi:MAG: glucoamylase family protein, partial [Acidobacteriota bacterium]